MSKLTKLCEYCGTEYSLQAHHILSFAKFPELRFVVDNGITLSKKMHKEFHNKYGRRNNTKEQIEEFIFA